MGDNVFEALNRLLCQFQINPNTLCFDVARPPFGFHPPNTTIRYSKTKNRLPFRQQRRNGFFEPVTIPSLKDALSLRNVSSSWDKEF